MSAERVLTAVVHQEEDWYVAQCLEADVASQGQSVEEAVNGLREAVQLYLTEAPAPDLTETPLVATFRLSA